MIFKIYSFYVLDLEVNLPFMAGEVVSSGHSSSTCSW